MGSLVSLMSSGLTPAMIFSLFGSNQTTTDESEISLSDNGLFLRELDTRVKFQTVSRSENKRPELYRYLKEEIYHNE